MFILSSIELFFMFSVALIIMPLSISILFLVFNLYIVKYIRIISLLSSLCLVVFLICLIYLLPLNNIFQFFCIFELYLLQTKTVVVFCLDSLNLYFLFLSIFVFYLCLMSCWLNGFFQYTWIFYSLFYFQEFLLHIVFLCFDLLVFFVLFEGLLITLFLFIGLYGTRRRKIRAVFLLILYTIFGSILVLLSLCFLYLSLGSVCFLYLYLIDMTFDIQKFLWLSFFLTFAIKVPMIPFHVWLPEAHVEAPTVGSIFLAGILLKVGTYGFLRFVLGLFTQASFYFYPLICMLGLVGLIYSSFCAICQLDMKRVIAYSSISHMNLIMLGLFSFDLLGLEGCVLQMLNHGVVSGGLFLCLGILYDRFHTRLFKYIGGIVEVMPLFTFFFLVLILANIAIPGTCSFMGEFLIFLSLLGNSGVVAFFGLFCMILSGVYSLWLFNRICFGNLNIRFISLFNDITFLEFSALTVVLGAVLVYGLTYLFYNSTIHLNLGLTIIHLFVNGVVGA